MTETQFNRHMVKLLAGYRKHCDTVARKIMSDAIKALATDVRPVRKVRRRSK
jgi:hypothetical protein